MKEYIELGKEIYDIDNIKQYWRMLVFIVRSLRNNKEMKGLIDLFQTDSLKRNIATVHPCIFEQATRYFFYYNSTFIERLSLIKEHFSFCDNVFNEEGLRCVYLGEGIILWNGDYQNQTLSVKLHFDGGHKKEGLMAITFSIGERLIYRIIFWIATDGDNKPALWIGALQGSPEGSKIIRDLTKYFWGYRPKNFILYTIRIIARRLAIEKIYAVSNYGFYANNHIRIDRKLKTSLDKFWEEAGGSVCCDPRFFDLPVIEPRKTLDQVQSHKRNLYRQRFSAMDEVSEIIGQAIKPYLKSRNKEIRGGKRYN